MKNIDNKRYVDSVGFFEIISNNQDQLWCVFGH